MRPRITDRSARQVIAMDSHALGTLQYIRRSMDAAGSFAVPGLAGIAIGVIGIAAAILASVPGLSRHWLAIWLTAAALALVSGASLMTQEAARAGLHLYRGPARKFFLCLSPSLGAGALLSLVLWSKGWVEALPGVWLLLYGCAVLSASVMATPLIAVMGTAFVALGLLAFVVAPAWTNLLLGAGFGGLHLLFGLMLGSKDER